MGRANNVDGGRNRAKRIERADRVTQIPAENVAAHAPAHRDGVGDPR
jgi:hypothetical protein